MADPEVDDSLGESQPKPARLQRLVAMVRDRDWVGVTIEVAVVTIGVLLAFQIDQWGQTRRQAREERQFLERMWRETAEAMAETEWAMTMHGRFRHEFIEGFNSLDDPAAMARLAETPNVGCRSAVMPGLGFNNTSFAELSASGRLNVVSDAELRSELRKVVAVQADAEANRVNNYAAALDNQRALEPYYVLSLDRHDNRTCRLNWPQLAGDLRARNALVRSARLHTLSWNKRAYLRDVLARSHNRVACALGKPDCRGQVPQIFRAPPLYDVIPPEARDDAAQSAAAYNGS